MRKKSLRKIEAGAITLLFITTVSTIVLPSNALNSIEGMTDNAQSFILNRNVTYYEYENENFDYRVEIVETTNTTITLHESYYVDNEVFCSFVKEFDANTRKMLGTSQEDFYAWLWINEEDLSDGIVQAGNKNLTLIETTPEYYVLHYYESSGAEGALYYNASSLILEQTYDTLVIDGDEFQSSTVLVGSGTISESDISVVSEEVDVIEQDNNPNSNNQEILNNPSLSAQGEEVYIQDYSNGPGPLGSYLFNPPYKNGGGYDDHRGEFGCCVHDASWSAIYYIGRMYNYGEVVAGTSCGLFMPPWGRGIAESSAWITGPGIFGKFNVGTSDNYKIEMRFRLYGAAETSAVWALWLGSGYAESKIVLTCYLYEYDTSYIAGSKTEELYRASSSPAFVKSWDNEWITVSFNAHLYKDKSYYFKAKLYTEHKAGFILFGGATALSGLEAQLAYVSVSPS